MTNATAIDRLRAGFKGFRAQYYDQRPELFEALKAGQKPKVLMIACSDSRIDPAVLTRSEPGELFVVRNVANIVPPYEPDDRHHGTSAAMEFAVRDLRVEHIILLGHSQCGGIRDLVGGLAKQPSPREFIGSWVSIVQDACVHAHADVNPDADLREVEQEALRVSLRNLRTYPWVAEKIDKGELDARAWWFDLDAGKLWEIRSDSPTAVYLD
jgi:carbonic anhydrase